MQSAAIEYLKAGFTVVEFPRVGIGESKKSPDKGISYIGLITPKKLVEGKFIDTNVGIDTEVDLVIVDCDSPFAEEWSERNLPKTEWRVRTGRGIHLGYRNDGDADRRIGVAGMGMDIICSGARVIMPPSIHATGKIYSWENASGKMPDLATLPIFDPYWLPAFNRKIEKVVTPDNYSS